MDPFVLNPYEPRITEDELQSSLLSIDPLDEKNRIKFMEKLKMEVENFEKYCRDTYSGLSNKLWSVIRQFTATQVDINNIQKLANSVVEIIGHLNEMIGKKFKFFVELKQRSDQNGKNQDKDFTEYLIENYKFCNLQFGDLICMLSDIYASVRDGRNGGDNSWIGAEIGSLKTYKYFIKGEDLLRIKLELVKNIPLQRKDIKQGVRMNQDKNNVIDNAYSNDGRGDTKRVTSIYLDNEKLRQYHQKLLKKEGSTQIRARWEGDSKRSTIEQKLDSYALRNSSKEIVDLDKEQIFDFFSGKLKLNAIKKEAETLPEKLQEFIKKHGLRPVIRGDYYRSIFQKDGDNKLQLSIDSTVELMKLDKNCSSIKNSESSTNRFTLPHAVLTIKASSNLPDWLISLLKKENLLTSANQFNKFCHGIAKLFLNQINALPQWFDKPSIHHKGYPDHHWFRQIVVEQNLFNSAAKGGEPNSKTSISRSNVSTNDDEDSSFGDLDSSAPLLSRLTKIPTKRNLPTINEDHENNGRRTSVRKLNEWKIEEKKELTIREKITESLFGKQRREFCTPTLQALRVEPKTYFANERTLLQWIQMSMLLAVGGATFITFTNSVSSAIGIGILVISLLFSFYGLGVYHYRRNSLRRKIVSGYYDDKWGPTVLTVILLIYITSSVALSIVFPANVILANGPPTVAKEYKLEISQSALNSGSAEQTLRNILDEMKSSIPNKVFSGDLSNKLTVSNISFWDTKDSCALRNSGYRLRESTDFSLDGLYFEQYTNFAHVSNNGQFSVSLDTKHPYALYKSIETVIPPYEVIYTREINDTDLMDNIPFLYSAADTYYQFFIFDTITDQSQWSKPLLKVNNLNLQLEKYGTVEIPLGFLGRKARIQAEILFYTYGPPVYGEVIISIDSYPGEDISITEFQELKNIFANLQAFKSLTPMVRGITNFFYEYNIFCTN